MASKIIKTVIQFRRDTTANWEANKDVIPASGEPCFDIELNTLKIGDGVTTYGELPALGGVSANFSADGKSIVLENNVFKLMGFDAAEVGAQPRKNADGQLEWVVPSTETAEGLQTTVAGLQSDVAALQEIVGTAEEGVDPLATRVSTLENQMDILNGTETEEGSVKYTVAQEVTAQIDEFATSMSDDGNVNTFKELVDYVATHAPEAADMAADITTLHGLVGETPVADQIASAVASKVDAVEGKSLVDDDLIAKLEAIEDTSEANKIEAINLGDTALEIDENKTVTIPVGAGLQGSEEIVVAEDGTLTIGVISMSKLVDDVTVSLDGGSASGE